MAENNDENQTVPVPGPGPDAPLRENPISKERSLTLEEMKELNLASDTHAIPPRGAERRENVPCIEMEIVMAVKDGIQGAADFVTGSVQKFDGYITDCAETAADFDYELTFSNWFFGLYGLSEFEKGYLGWGGSFSIPKAMGCVGRGAVNLVEGMIAFPAQAIGHPIKTIEGVVQTPMEYMERFRDGNWTERVTAGTEIAAMIGMTAESAMKLKDSLKKEKAMKESAQRETAKSRENGIPGGCFTAGTGVLTKEGLKAIEDIRAGDYVLAEDVESGRQEYKKVVRTTVRRTEKIIHLVIAGEEIETTGDHPFRVTDRGWVPAEELQLYDETELSDGSHALIEDLWQEKTGEETAVYNMEVEEFHTYYIANSGVLVHNNDGCARDSGEVRIRKNEGGSGSEITNKFPNEAMPQDGKILDYYIDNGRIKGIEGINNVDFVITTDNNLIIGNKHHYLGNGKDVLAAGQLKINGQGQIKRIDNLSGHYRPTVDEAMGYQSMFENLGLDLNNTWLEYYRIDIDTDGLVVDTKLDYIKMLGGK